MKKSISIISVALISSGLLSSCGFFSSGGEVRFAVIGDEPYEFQGAAKQIVVTTTDHDEKGRTEVTSIATYEYDDDFNLLKTTSVVYEEGTEEFSFEEYILDDNGNTIEKIVTDGDGTETARYQSQWKGKEEVRQTSIAGGETEYYIRYKYTGGREVQRSYHTAEGLMYRKITYKWDGDRITESLVTDAAKVKEQIINIEYDGDSGMTVRYDTEEEEYAEYFPILETYKFNDRGNYSFYSTVSPDSEESYSYEYVYDNKGNWTERRITDVNEGRLVRTVKREITY